jgi:hypothetical protein
MPRRGEVLVRFVLLYENKALEIDPYLIEKLAPILRIPCCPPVA